MWNYEGRKTLKRIVSLMLIFTMIMSVNVYFGAPVAVAAPKDQEQATDVNTLQAEYFVLADIDWAEYIQNKRAEIEEGNYSFLLYSIKKRYTTLDDCRTIW